MGALAGTPRRQAPGGEDFEIELREIIRRRSFRRGQFTLASGARSDLYFNLKPTMMCARGAYLSARAFLATLTSRDKVLVVHAEGGV